MEIRSLRPRGTRGIRFTESEVTKLSRATSSPTPCHAPPTLQPDERETEMLVAAGRACRPADAAASGPEAGAAEGWGRVQSPSAMRIACERSVTHSANDGSCIDGSP